MKCQAKRFLLIALCLVSAQAVSETRYKCETWEAVNYQYKPCSVGARQTVLEDAKPTEPETVGVEVDGVVVSDFSVKPTYQNSLGEQWFSVKLKVSNNTNQEKSVFITYQAIDDSGYEIENHLIDGKVSPGKVEVLTDTNRMKIADFKRIKEWKIKK